MTQQLISTTIGVAGAARLLCINPRTLRTLVKRGEVPPPVRVGPRRLIWRVATLEAFLANGGTPEFIAARARPGRPRKRGAL